MMICRPRLRGDDTKMRARSSMNITDIFIKRPVLAIVLSALILVLGIRSVGLLPIQQYPTIESAVITVTTNFIGADPETIAAFITAPLENAIAQSNGIDYMTSSSGQNVSNIQVNLLLNYNADNALTEVNTQVNSALNQLPTNAQLPGLQITVGQSIASMYLGFYSNELASNQINDYLLRVVQPKLQAVHGVQQASILGNNQFALRAWLDPKKLAGYGITPAEIRTILQKNNFITASGRTDGQIFILNFSANTALTTLDGFKNMVIKAQNGAIIHLKDVATVTLGSENYNTTVSFNKKSAVYIGITVAPNANLLSVIDNVKKQFNIKTTTDNKEAVKSSDIVFICVKPQDVDKVLYEIKDAAKIQLIVSIAAGITIKHIQSILKNKKIIRVMPNINCIAGEIAAGFSAGKYAGKEDINCVSEILNSAGKAFLIDESLLDAVTALSGSGPAFFAYFTGLMIDAGIKNGLDRKIAMELAVQTAFGTAKLMSEKKISAEDLIKIVASPNGTTMAGLSVLDGSDLKLILNKTISASIRRSKELSVE